MGVRVDVRSELPCVHGKSLYRRSEFGLVYETYEATSEVEDKKLSDKIDQQLGITSRNVFVMADTLTLVFSERDGLFLSLDAYTNDDRWERSGGSKCPTGATGALVLAEPVDDRVSLDVVPSYCFDGVDSTLSIGFGVQPSRYFEIGEGLFVGIANGELAEVVLKHLQFE